jgi:SAM-dependent MidA family methyltransferase
MSLENILKAKISKEGPLPFVDFMQQALYHPNYGYYTTNSKLFSKHSDFITAPELTPLFGFTIANECTNVIKALKDPIILEFGAGSGSLCVAILQQLQKLQALPRQYKILEISGNLRMRQEEMIKAKIPDLAHLVSFITTLEHEDFAGIILANEVLDAMPVHLCSVEHGKILQAHVALEQNKLQLQALPCVTSNILSHVEAVFPDARYYQSEFNPFLEPWLSSLSSVLSQGMVLLIDYGFPQHEYYHPDRQHGTLMCHYQNTAHSDPLMHLGAQDITAHVDFTHLANAALKADFHVQGYTNQASFLLANGLLECLQDLEEGIYKIQQQQHAKKLLGPQEMGELFKVMALTKNLDVDLSGFKFYDKRVSL